MTNILGRLTSALADRYTLGLDSAETAMIWSIPSAGGGKPTPIMTFDHALIRSFLPRWASRGDQIYVMEQNTESDIYVMELEQDSQ